jgi:uncharacterized membrane protein required for colicin V production
MDWGFTGLLDVLIVVFALINILLGFKKGFMNIMLSFVGVIAILIFAFFFCTQVAAWFHGGKLFTQIEFSFANNISEGLGGTEGKTWADVISAATGIPSWMTQLFANAMGNPDPTEAVNTVATTLKTWIMNGIAFVGIVVVGLLLLLILKIITKNLRSYTAIKVIDGVLGVVLSVGIYFAILTGLFALINLIVSQNWEWLSGVNNWLRVDMQLDSPDKFRISKVLYKNNFFVKFFSAIFGWK